MQRTKLLSQLIAGTVLSLALAPAIGPVARSQSDQIFLLDAQCVSTGPGRWKYNIAQVSVGRAVYKSYWYMGPGTQFSSMTCRIRPEKSEDVKFDFQTLYLEFGMRDNDRGSPSNTVNIYLDGRRAASQNVGPGDRASLSFNVTNVKNVAIETVCSSDAKYCDRVYFLKGALEPVPPVPTTDTSEPGQPPTTDTSEPVPPPPTDTPDQQPPPPPSDSSKPGELPSL